MYHKSEYVYFVECPEHGTREGIAPSAGRWIEPGKWSNARYAYCPDHRIFSLSDQLALDARVIERPTRVVDRTGKCGGPCLNGKHKCDCQCQGQCHGAGTCSCKV